MAKFIPTNTPSSIGIASKAKQDEAKFHIKSRHVSAFQAAAKEGKPLQELRDDANFINKFALTL